MRPRVFAGATRVSQLGERLTSAAMLTRQGQKKAPDRTYTLTNRALQSCPEIRVPKREATFGSEKNGGEKRQTALTCGRGSSASGALPLGSSAALPQPAPPSDAAAAVAAAGTGSGAGADSSTASRARTTGSLSPGFRVWAQGRSTPQRPHTQHLSRRAERKKGSK